MCLLFLKHVLCFLRMFYKLHVYLFLFCVPILLKCACNLENAQAVHKTYAKKYKE